MKYPTYPDTNQLKRRKMNKNDKARTFSKAMLKTAKKRGRRDGKNEVPRQNWPENSVPYLTQLNKQFNAMADSLKLELEQVKLNRENQKVEGEKESIRNQAISQVVTDEFEQAKNSLDKIQKSFNGEDNEVPTAKFARVRLINNYLYGFFLMVLGYGEFLITVPALRFLLGEKNAVATIVAASVSFLTIATAHTLGISLKTKLDRSKPHSELVTGFLWIMGAFVSSTVLFLSYIRAAKGNTVAGNLAQIPDDKRIWFLMGLYAILQFSFITVGAYLAFLHHSEIETALNRGKLVYAWKKFRMRRSLRNQGKKNASVKGMSINQEPVTAQEVRVLEERLKLLMSQYKEVCAVYRDANIHSRRDEIHGSHVALKEEPLSDDFLGLIQNNFHERSFKTSKPVLIK